LNYFRPKKIVIEVKVAKWLALALLESIRSAKS
jgi:hypothetical protein